ncbi:uncharacterized protein PRCAT00001667001 [Priceomyces carsonii]|uniref:uncharacterized protein n=1 Tax=Priceomyces carsonii TaxID=28549 RepID=UPI002ED97B9A|nr:unnamed protein product [Priceomyces carsonii]
MSQIFIRKSKLQGISNILLANVTPWCSHISHIRRYTTNIETLKEEVDSREHDDSASTTGVLDYKRGKEVVMYFDHVYPLSFSRWKQYLQYMLPLQRNYNDDNLKKQILELSNSDSNPLHASTRILDFVPLRRDGGAFAKFSVPPNVSTDEFTAQIKENVRKHEAKYNERILNKVSNMIWNRFPYCYSVKGTPWIEDLRRFPSPKLKVMFDGQPLNEEELYVLFRRYGLILDIIPASSTASFATVIFKNVRSAICARNCVTGIILDQEKTVLHLQYIPVKRVNYINEFIFNHQKISIPVILAILATVAVLIFDPIREWFIEQKITHKFSFENYKDNMYISIIFWPFRKVHSLINNSYDYIDEKLYSQPEEISNLNYRSTADESNLMWNERKEMSKQLKLWIYENVNTYIIVYGPKGTGKQEFVMDNTIQRDPKLRHKTLYIDCEKLAKSRTDNALLKSTASELGYFPIFTWVNGISQFIDLGVQGLTGQKSGFSESKETQLKNMFLLATQALRKVALSDYNCYRNNIIRQEKKRKRDLNISDDLSLDSEVLKEEDYLQQFPEVKPIVIIDKYSSKSDSNNIHGMIADWTSQLIQSNLAHVIYITNDVGSLQYLNISLPNLVFKMIALYDASQSNAKLYLLEQLGNDINSEDSLDICLEPLGGRMLDLQAYIRRIKSGESPQDAIKEMVVQAAEQITTFFLSNSKAKSDETWNTSQVWVIMKLLSENHSISFDELTKSSLFKDVQETQATLSTLEKHDLVCLQKDKGILNSICSGRPLFKAAFKELVNDPKIYKIYETNYLNNLISLENKKIMQYEDELHRIRNLKLDTRSSYVFNKIESSSKNIIDYENQINNIASRGQSKGSSFLSFRL